MTASANTGPVTDAGPVGVQVPLTFDILGAASKTITDKYDGKDNYIIPGGWALGAEADLFARQDYEQYLI
jgi:hypothetical protein